MSLGVSPMEAFDEIPGFLGSIASSCAPYRIQNPSESQNTPRNTPRILSRNQNTEKIRKNYENPRFLYIFRIFSVFWFREGVRGVFRGVFWLSEGFCIL